jgi:hypothetical protein
MPEMTEMCFSLVYALFGGDTPGKCMSRGGQGMGFCLASAGICMSFTVPPHGSVFTCSWEVIFFKRGEGGATTVHWQRCWRRLTPMCMYDIWQKEIWWITVHV